MGTKPANVTKRDRFFNGEVFLSAEGWEMYYQKDGKSGIGSIYFDGKYLADVKSVNNTCFSWVIVTIKKMPALRQIVEVVEYEDLKFVE